MSTRRGRGTFLAVAGAAVIAQVAAVMVVVGFNFGVAAPPVPEPPAPAAAAASATPGAAPLPGTMPWAQEIPAVAPMGPSAPLHLTVGRLGIDTDLMTLGLNPDGTVEVPPEDPDSPAGWYRHLATPGERGPAVILGHVDSRSGPGVFYALGASVPGDQVVVTRTDGSTATFRVDRVATFPRADFPTSEVYGAIGHAGLRLVTCGGEYDRDNGGYQNNVVVFASLVPSPLWY